MIITIRGYKEDKTEACIFCKIETTNHENSCQNYKR